MDKAAPVNSTLTSLGAAVKKNATHEEVQVAVKLVIRMNSGGLDRRIRV